MFVAVRIGMLGLSDTTAITMWAISLTVTIGIGVFMALWLRSLDARTKKIEALETDLKRTAKELVNAEITLQTKSLQASIDRLTQQMEAVHQRQADGDAEVDRLDTRAQGIALALKDQTNELQKWMMEKFATKNDVGLVNDKIDGLGDRVSQLAVEQARAQGAADAGHKLRGVKER